MDSKVLVTCQQGLRSQSAAAQLARAGYANLAWVKGGLNKSQAGEVPTRDGSDVRYAGIGGMSSMLHWTRLQQENTGPLGGWKTAIAVVCPFLTTCLCSVQVTLVYHEKRYRLLKGPETARGCEADSVTLSSYRVFSIPCTLAVICCVW